MQLLNYFTHGMTLLCCNTSFQHFCLQSGMSGSLILRSSNPEMFPDKVYTNRRNRLLARTLCFHVPIAKCFGTVVGIIHSTIPFHHCIPPNVDTLSSGGTQQWGESLGLPLVPGKSLGNPLPC